MSAIVTYAFFGEDAAQRNFLEKYLQISFPDTFIEDENERWRFKAGSGTQVDKLLPDALRQRVLLGLDVLFVGRDVDTEHKPQILIRQGDYETTCKGHPAILMLPVQCIEHWLWYIKRHKQEPGKKAPLEAQPRPLCKQAVYGDTKVVTRQVELANTVLANLDVDWLVQHAESFRHFHSQVVDFLEAYKQS